MIGHAYGWALNSSTNTHVNGMLVNHYGSQVTEGWSEIDKHYSLELCFSIEKTA